MDIHPYTNHDIARLRGEERLVRALAAQKAREVAESPGDGRARRVARSVAGVFQRIGRREPSTAAHARSSAM